jgi:transmembrane sensor
MSERQAASEIDDEACAWALRLDGRDLDLVNEPELEAWLAADPRRQGALLRAQAALSFVDRGRALAAPGAANTAWLLTRSPSRRGLLIGAGGGAVAAGVAAGALLASEVSRYDTGLGEIRRVPLKDGSLIAINTRSTLKVALSPHMRRVKLEAGEAWFEVAKDAARPFVVQAGPVRIRAVGTAFSVRRQGEGCDVLVTEGVVEAWLDGFADQPARLAAGFKSLIAAGRDPITVQAPEDIERSLSWRTGSIALDGQSLAEAAEEFNRYNERRIVIDDPALAKRRFVGLFRTNDPEGFAAAVAATIGARVTMGPGIISLAGDPARTASGS